MIPKIIYYTWISDKPLPEKFSKYIDGWKKLMPDYDIRQISLENVKRGAFVDKCLAEKKFVMAGHYARCQELYENGGIYLDIDVEVIKRFDDLLNEKCFLGNEDQWVTNNAVIGCEKGHPLMLDCMKFMDSFDMNQTEIELKTGPRMFTTLARPRQDVTIYPPEYFYPYHYTEQFIPQCITPNTYAIHHWANTWNEGVSIIIPCYKQAQFLGDAIGSALANNPLEVIVVNDGSPDNTSEVARMFPVKLIEKPNGGLSSARNAGIREAKGKWVLTLDSDDMIDSEFIKKTIGKADVVSTGLEEFGDSNAIWLPPMERPELKDFLGHNKINCCSLFKREIWEKVGGYDENMKDGYEDWEFWIRVAAAGYKFYATQEVLFMYRRHGQTMVNHAQANHDKIVDYIRKKHASII
jgi:hypothetical protein